MKTMNLWYAAAGLVLVSVFFRMPPGTRETVVRVVAPLAFLAAVGITVCRARGRADEGNEDESGE